MLDFFKNYFFFLLDKNKKEKYRQRVMHNDHFTYRVLLVVIMVLQAVMFGISFTNSRTTGDTIDICYKCAYGFLFIACLTCFLLSNYFYKKGKTFPYFLVISLTMFAIMLWGAAISLFDSVVHVDLTYLGVAMIACASFICLEPWVPTLFCLVVSVLFDIVFAILRYTGFITSYQGFGFFAGTATIVGVGIVGLTFNFYRRINAIGLELEVSELNTTLHGKAYVDDLTKVYNRRYLTEHIDDKLNYGTPGTGIMMIDLDHFKNVNDTYGHQVGDTCLAMLGEQLNKLIKDKKAYALRYGGEEFLLYFDNITKDELRSLAEQLRETMEGIRITVPGGNKMSYTISAGLAMAQGDISYNELINEADKALYRAKKTRNTVSF